MDLCTAMWNIRPTREYQNMEQSIDKTLVDQKKVVDMMIHHIPIKPLAVAVYTILKIFKNPVIIVRS